MTIQRGDIWWADLGLPQGSEAGYRRPVVVIQADSFNESRIRTVICIPLTTNLRLGEAPGNCFIRSEKSSLRKDSVANVSQIVTLDKTMLVEKVSTLPPGIFKEIEEGIKLILDLFS